MHDHQAKVRLFLERRGWINLAPADVAKSIAIESAELLELFQWTHEEAAKVRGNVALVEKIQDELADVINYCVTMSVILNIDTDSIVAKKLASVTKKYPANRFSGMSKERSQKIYDKLKKKHRAGGL